MCTAQPLARYSITFTGKWSQASFPKQYPLFRPPAQWSSLLGECSPCPVPGAPRGDQNGWLPGRGSAPLTSVQETFAKVFRAPQLCPGFRTMGGQGHTARCRGGGQTASMGCSSLGQVVPVPPTWGAGLRVQAASPGWCSPRLAAAPLRGRTQLRLQPLAKGPVREQRAARVCGKGRGLGADAGDGGGGGAAAERARGVLCPRCAQRHRADVRRARGPLQALAGEWAVGQAGRRAGGSEAPAEHLAPRCPSWSASCPALTGSWASIAWTCVTAAAGGSRWPWTCTPTMPGPTAASLSRPPISPLSRRTQ